MKEAIEHRKMRRGDVRNGKSFIHKDEFKEEVFVVVKEHGNMYLKKKNVYAGRVKEVTEDGFDVSIYLFAMEVKVRVLFKNCLVRA